MRAARLNIKALAIAGAVFFHLVCFSTRCLMADVIINVLAVNGTDTSQDKEINFSLPGEIKPADVLDAAGLMIDYSVADAGYFLHQKVKLEPKETKTLKVKVRDVWRISSEDVQKVRSDIEAGFNEMGEEKNAENGLLLKQKLFDKLDYVLLEQDKASGGIDQRINAYRNHQQKLRGISSQARLIDFWRTDAADEESKKVITYVINVENPGEKTRKIKQQHPLPPEVMPEYIVDQQGYEIRFDEKKGSPFLFKEEDFSPGEKKIIKIGIKDVWFIQTKDIEYVREQTNKLYDTLKTSKFSLTAKSLYEGIINNLDLITALQTETQPDIRQHIGVYRLNKKRFEQAKNDLDALEKLLARLRADLEKSKIKNVMQKIQALQSLAKISKAIFDKKPTINAAWKIIGGVMIFLALFTIIHFITWFVRTSKEKKQEEITLPKETKDAA